VTRGEVVSPPPAVETSALTKVYGEGETRVEALRGVDLIVRPGDFVSVMGPSGSGKSTLLHLIGGLDRPSGGVVLVGGQDLAELDDDALTLLRRRRIGFVFQFFNLLPVLTAKENVALPLLVDGMSEAEAGRRAAAALKTVGVGHRQEHRPGALSGGEQQRVAVARALVTEPVLILADEPTGNLDSAGGEQVLTLLRRLADEVGQTILMVTHDPRAAALSDRIISMRDGRVAEEQVLERGASVRDIMRTLEELA
jgi:putative ABC transport system ATP-binding protein